MFGYINPSTPNLFIKDDILYRALYCGMCKSIGKGCGNVAKSALTYDVAFISALLHNIAGFDVKIEKRRCALHPFRRRNMTIPDDISVAIGCMNTILAYHKLLDDRQDGEFKGRFAFVYRKGYKKAAKLHPGLAEIASRGMEMQRALEKGGCDVIEQACEPTAIMMREFSDYVLGDHATDHTRGLMYAIGKWIYLADALDDYDKDAAKGRFNVFRNAFGEDLKEKAVAAHGGEINFLFNALFAEMRTHLAGITFHFNRDLTDNIILIGIPTRTRRLVYGKCGEGKKEDRNE